MFTFLLIASLLVAQGSILATLFEEPTVIEDVNYDPEPIPELTTINEEIEEIIEEEINRTHHDDVLQHWWEVDGEIPDNPNVPNEIELWCVVIGVEYDIAPELIMAICKVESEFDPSAKNGQFTGCMQVGTKVHKTRIKNLGYTTDQMYEIEPCIRVATDYLSELIAKRDGDVVAALLEYNGNSTGLARYYKTGQIAHYASKILKISEQLERENGK